MFTSKPCYFCDYDRYKWGSELTLLQSNKDCERRSEQDISQCCHVIKCFVFFQIKRKALEGGDK